MKTTIIETPFRVTLAGLRGAVDGNCYGEVGKRLMDQMWAEIRRLRIENRGLNHWVCLPDSQMFTGVELTAAGHQPGSLELLDVFLPRYLQHIHQGSYSELPGVWQQLSDQLNQQGETRKYPSL